MRRLRTCHQCGYDLKGLPSNAAVCPECGDRIRLARQSRSSKVPAWQLWLLAIGPSLITATLVSAAAVAANRIHNLEGIATAAFLFSLFVAFASPLAACAWSVGAGPDPSTPSDRTYAIILLLAGWVISGGTILTALVVCTVVGLKLSKTL